MANRSLKHYFTKMPLQNGGVYEKHITFLLPKKFSTEGVNVIRTVLPLSPQAHCSSSANVSEGTGKKQVYSTERYVIFSPVFTTVCSEVAGAVL